MKPMSPMNTALLALVVLVTAATAWWIWTANPGHSQGGDPHMEHAEDEPPKGPHGGRLLSDGPFAVEVTMFERGVPPEFRVFAYHEDQPVDPAEVSLGIELERLDGEVQRYAFTAAADYLRGQGTVAEPHSFDVSVKAEYQGQMHQWQYENHEGRTRISAAMARASNIGTATSGPQVIRETLTLTGYVQTDPNRLSHVRARFPGIVESVKTELGEYVKAGAVLATVQSNESLQTYTVKAPIGGLIVRRDIQSGEATGNTPLFVIADLSRVWVEFDVFGQNLNRVKQGQPVTVEALGEQPVQGTIGWISPLAAHASQSVNARVELANEDNRLRPGQFVRGRVTVAEYAADVAVAVSALQTYRDFDVVFAKLGDTYEVRMLTLGKRDRQWAEVLDGLKPGVDYVTDNSYLIKADIEKSGASHDH